MQQNFAAFAKALSTTEEATQPLASKPAIKVAEPKLSDLAGSLPYTVDELEDMLLENIINLSEDSKYKFLLYCNDLFINRANNAKKRTAELNQRASKTTATLSALAAHNTKHHSVKKESGPAPETSAQTRRYKATHTEYVNAKLPTEKQVNYIADFYVRYSIPNYAEHQTLSNSMEASEFIKTLKANEHTYAEIPVGNRMPKQHYVDIISQIIFNDTETNVTPVTAPTVTKDQAVSNKTAKLVKDLEDLLAGLKK